MAEQKKRHPWRGLLLAAGLTAAVLLVLIAALVFLLFEPVPMPEPQPPTLPDVVFHSRLAGRVLKQVWRGKPERDELVLTQQNVESLLRLGDQAWELGLKPAGLPTGVRPPRCWRLQLLPRGRAMAAFPYDTGWRILRGGVLMLKLEFSLQKEPDKPWQITVLKAKLGKIALSPAWLTGKIRAYLTRQEAAGKFNGLNAAVTSFWLDPGGRAHLIYRPAGLLLILQKR